MKALAAEMVRNFGGRLEALGIIVRELTGDMSLTKQEILKTQASKQAQSWSCLKFFSEVIKKKSLNKPASRVFYNHVI